MDQAIKTQALAKLATFDPRIGHPMKYIDYDYSLIEESAHS